MNKNESMFSKILTFIITIPFVALIFLWYGHVILMHNLPYWKWIIIAVVMTVVRLAAKAHPVTKGIYQTFFVILFATVIISQVLYWMDTINLPLMSYWKP